MTAAERSEQSMRVLFLRRTWRLTPDRHIEFHVGAPGTIDASNHVEVSLWERAKR